MEILILLTCGTVVFGATVNPTVTARSEYGCESDSDCGGDNMYCSSLGNCLCKVNHYYSEFERGCLPLRDNIAWLLVLAAIPLVIIATFCVSCIRLARTDAEY